MSKQDSYVLIVILVSVSLFLGLTGTLGSGYHFTDDHEIITLKNDLKTESVFSVATQWIREDLNSRYRPVYYFHRVVEARAFGDNFLLWSLWTAMLAFAAFASFYLAMRKLRFSYLQSLLFLMLSFLGPQMAVWWRLGPNETIGMVFLGLSLHFLASCEKQYTLNTALFCVSLIFASLSKESFTIIVPAFVAFKIWNERNLFNLSLKDVIRKNWLLLIPLLIMLANLCIIVFIVGTNGIGYAGVDPGIFNLVRGMSRIVAKAVNSTLSFVLILSSTLGVLYYVWSKNQLLRFFRQILFPLGFAFLIVIPNLILYAKSGMGERYLLPSTIGIAFLIISINREIRVHYRWLANLIIIAFLLLYIRPAYSTYKYAKAFAEEGFQTSKFLSLVTANVQPNSNVLLVANPRYNFEWSYSLNTYLILAKEVKLFAYGIEDRSQYGDFENGLSDTWHGWFKGRELKDIGNKPDMILFFDRSLANAFFYGTKMSESGYTEMIIGNASYAVFKKR